MPAAVRLTTLAPWIESQRVCSMSWRSVQRRASSRDAAAWPASRKMLSEKEIAAAADELIGHEPGLPGDRIGERLVDGPDEFASDSGCRRYRLMRSLPLADAVERTPRPRAVPPGAAGLPAEECVLDA